jgi:hypothetical protein
MSGDAPIIDVAFAIRVNLREFAVFNIVDDFVTQDCPGRGTTLGEIMKTGWGNYRTALKALTINWIQPQMRPPSRHSYWQ